jgi:hypothetical protein
MGVGTLCAEVGFLRALEYFTYPHWTGNWSWLPYLIVTAVSAFLAAAIWAARRKPNRTTP